MILGRNFRATYSETTLKAVVPPTPAPGLLKRLITHKTNPMLLDIIFLDIDGVLNPDKDHRPAIFAPDCVRHMKRILKECPQAQVVFSTTWRTGFTFFVLGWVWSQHGLPVQRVIGRTPDIQLDRRGEEIRKWLAEAPTRSREHRVRRFVAIDDEVAPLLEEIPRAAVFACDPYHGLTEAVAEGVIRYLNA